MLLKMNRLYITDTKLPDSLNQVVSRLSLLSKVTPGTVRNVLIEADVNPEDLLSWADYEHPVENSYGRKLVHKAANFEMMVMSWQPGDFSTIHDHGHTQWGAVQIFGPAEHATFRWEDQRLITLSRTQVKPFTVVGVSHTLIHQMGNPTEDTPFLSLHIYGDVKHIESVTGDARIFNLENDTIERVDGGVFYELPDEQIKTVEVGPRGDFPTWLRNRVERIRRLRIIAEHGSNIDQSSIQENEQSLFSAQRHSQLLDELSGILDENSHVTNDHYWRNLRQELIEASRMQNRISGENRNEDAFQNYAFMYDELIGKPCLNTFMKDYLSFVIQAYRIDLQSATLLSLGCGTGLIEEYMIQNMGITYEQVYGVDISEAMVEVAQQRIQAEQADILTMDTPSTPWNIAYSGLNVLQYLQPEYLETAVHNIAKQINSGGYFIGDFITPDHIRWYPHVVVSDDQNLISLRQPRLIEKNGKMFQESEIINLNFTDERMNITYSGKHKRFLPAMNRIRTYFEHAFGGFVDLFDAVTLNPIPDHADSCASTRYLVVAKKL